MITTRSYLSIILTLPQAVTWAPPAFLLSGRKQVALISGTLSRFSSIAFSFQGGADSHGAG